MKNKSQKKHLLDLFKKGKTLNLLTAFRLTGTFKLSTRVSEFERLLKLKFKKTKVNFKTRYNTRGYYFNYKLVK